MTKKVDFTAHQKDYAIFLPALSSFYSCYVGKQRANPSYVEPSRMPQALPDMEMFNWLNPTQSVFPYQWSLYSGGHANLDLSKPDPREDMIRDRDPNSFVLGDSGGFQIAKGVWEGDWKSGSGCQKAQKRRELVLNWLDNCMNYGMVLDIPTIVLSFEKGMKNSGIKTYQDAIKATEYNNDYFIDNRRGVKNGGGKFLNVLQGTRHDEADQWYDVMKKYSDPNIYPDTHFDGWAMGGQNKCDVHLTLKRLVALRHEGLLQEGIHDWMHFLGTSRLEWALMLTDIQRSLRSYVNPKLTISFDAASPFLGAANGSVYWQNFMPQCGRWSIRMKSIADDKRLSSDSRQYSVSAIAEGLTQTFQDSIISEQLQMKDICHYAAGELNKIGKEGRTSWDSFSYFLIMAHNVAMHIEAVQEANRLYDSGSWPASLWHESGDHAKFRDIVEEIFATSSRSKSEKIIEKYDSFWMAQSGSGGVSGKKIKNANAVFHSLFDLGGTNDDDDDILDEDNTAILDQLEEENDND